jgi:GT2 family glycosyltransferase
MKTIYILILNYNGYDDTKKCLATLHYLKATNYSIKVVVIDNGSSAGQLEKLKKLLQSYKTILLMENGKNMGFAAGNNVGIRYALSHKADFILLLNNDTISDMNYLQSCIKRDVPIISPVVKYQEFKDQKRLIYDLGGVVNWTTGRTTHNNVYQKEMDHFKEKKPIVVDYVAGCCMLVKREVFEWIGLLDEKYFIYFEDVDFCIEAKKHGFTTYVDPISFVYHKLGGSMDRWSKRAIFHNLYGNFIFIAKHLGWRRITGFAYLFVLTTKIIIDRIRKNY